MRAVITATGSYLPRRVVSNEALIAQYHLDSNDEWIRTRSGIVQRYIAAEGEATSHLATEAARAAMARAGVFADGIDGVVVGTSTPDTTMPSVATKVQAALGIKHGAALDVMAACTGFIAALATAHGLIQTGMCKRILVIGAETMTRILDFTDRGTCILFGDGAGAVILEAMPEEKANGRGILATTLEADGSFGPLLGTNGGTSSTQTAGAMFMQGQEVFRHGVEKMASTTREAVGKAGLELSEVDWLVAHQANGRMIASIARQLKLDESRCIVTVDKHANTSAASIPLALDVAVKDGRIKPGNIVAMPALGAGLTWGCCVVKW